MLKLFLAVKILLSIVITCKSIPHGDTEMNTATPSMQDQLHGSLVGYVELYSS